METLPNDDCLVKKLMRVSLFHDRYTDVDLCDENAANCSIVAIPED